MALNYTYLKYKEEHSITNNGATFINYEVTKVNFLNISFVIKFRIYRKPIVSNKI